MKKINPLISWWMTPKLPYEDIYGLPLLKSKNKTNIILHTFSKWLIHPIKRRIAKMYIMYLQRTTDIFVIGVTGSAGKSTTVSLISNILSLKGKTVRTPPGIDPVYNVPNTILKTPRGTKFLVLELSVEYKGEMDYYLWLVKPDMGVITNIFPAHTLFLGGVEGVLEEKSKLVKNLGPYNIAVLNSSDENLKKVSKDIKAKVEWFGKGTDLLDENKNIARTIGKLMGIEKNKIEHVLSKFIAPEHRLNIVKAKSGFKILDDTYNSNPKAAVAALEYFLKISSPKQQKIVILGDMLELGKFEKEGHKMLGRAVAESDIEIAIGVGSSTKIMTNEINKINKKIKTYQLQNSEDILPVVKPIISKNSHILVKGSRSLGLDKIVEKLSRL